jgi:Flp pilus assembly CpaF family ATPase
MSSYIPGDERIVTVEDAAELQLHQEHVLTLESRPPTSRARAQVTIRDLVKNTLRMRPDRIVVGECPWRRGPRHAPGHEHRPRRLADHHPLQQPP